MDSSPGSNSGDSTSKNSQLLPPRKRQNFVTPNDENEDITDQSPPQTSNQSSPTPKDDTEDVIMGQSSSSTPEENVESDSASKTISAWKRLYDINILKGVNEYYKKNGAYPFDNDSEMRKFYESWMEKHGVPIHVDEDGFCDKMVTFRERFFLNRQIERFTALDNQPIEDWMDPKEVEIYQLSYKIWGPCDDDVKKDDGDDGKDSSSEANQGGSSFS